MKKSKIKGLAAVIALLLAMVAVCTTPVMASATEDAPQTDSKKVILEYAPGETIDVSALFDEQPVGAEYSFGAYAPAAAELEGSMLTVTTPGSFRIVQTVGDTEIWIALGVQVNLTVTTKDQTLSVGAMLSSTLNDIVSVEGLMEGHTVTGVMLIPDVGGSIGSHDVIKAISVTVVNAEDEDVSSCYNVSSVSGKLHSYSSEWGVDETNHYHVCSAFDCDVQVGSAAHDYENACDASCDVCLSTREVPDHRWSEYQVVLEPTEETEGEQFHVCMECGRLEFEKIPVVKGAPVFLIVCVIIACALVLGTVAFVVVRNIKKKNAAVSAVEADTKESEEKPEA